MRNEETNNPSTYHRYLTESRGFAFPCFMCAYGVLAQIISMRIRMAFLPHSPIAHSCKSTDEIREQRGKC